jgi:hypothetical protein
MGMVLENNLQVKPIRRFHINIFFQMEQQKMHLAVILKSDLQSQASTYTVTVLATGKAGVTTSTYC